MTAFFFVSACCRTDQGRVRANNEDSCLTDIDHHLFLLADGMGGAAGGEQASSLFTATVSAHYSLPPPDNSPELIRNRIRESFYLANNIILDHATKDLSLKGMGCTGELLSFHNDMYAIGHVGDSRCYRLRGDKLNRLTRDHSLLQQQLDLGLISKREDKHTQLGNVLMRAIGVSPRLEVDTRCGKLQAGDLFLICSDGLYNMVSEADIAMVLSFNSPLELKADILVTMANEAGGKDNITVVLVEVDPEGRLRN